MVDKSFNIVIVECVVLNDIRSNCLKCFYFFVLIKKTEIIFVYAI